MISSAVDIQAAVSGSAARQLNVLQELRSDYAALQAKPLPPTLRPQLVKPRERIASCGFAFERFDDRDFLDNLVGIFADATVLD